MYHFEHINHDTHLDFLIKYLQILFERGDNVHQYCLPDITYCKRFFYLEVCVF